MLLFEDGWGAPLNNPVTRPKDLQNRMNERQSGESNPQTLRRRQTLLCARTWQKRDKPSFVGALARKADKIEVPDRRIGWFGWLKSVISVLKHLIVDRLHQLLNFTHVTATLSNHIPSSFFRQIPKICAIVGLVYKVVKRKDFQH